MSAKAQVVLICVRVSKEGPLHLFCFFAMQFVREVEKARTLFASAKISRRGEMDRSKRQDMCEKELQSEEPCWTFVRSKLLMQSFGSRPSDRLKSFLPDCGIGSAASRQGMLCHLAWDSREFKVRRKRREEEEKRRKIRRRKRRQGGYVYCIRNGNEKEGLKVQRHPSEVV